jgi:hypothetical protein
MKKLPLLHIFVMIWVGLHDKFLRFILCVNFVLFIFEAHKQVLAYKHPSILRDPELGTDSDGRH